MKSQENTINTLTGNYKQIENEKFINSITNKKEFIDNKITERFKDIYCLEPQQRFLSNFINPLTDYNSILVYHSVGVGKTLTAISIAENFKNDYHIVLMTKNKNIELNFKRELFGVCSSYFENEIEKSIYKNVNHEDHELIKKN